MEKRTWYVVANLFFQNQFLNKSDSSVNEPLYGKDKNLANKALRHSQQAVLNRHHKYNHYKLTCHANHHVAPKFSNFFFK